MTPKQLDELASRLDELDIEVSEAEMRGDVEAQIKALRARARTWRKWARLLDKAGRDASHAVNAASTDDYEAAKLSREVQS